MINKLTVESVITGKKTIRKTHNFSNNSLSSTCFHQFPPRDCNSNKCTSTNVLPSLKYTASQEIQLIFQEKVIDLEGLSPFKRALLTVRSYKRKKFHIMCSTRNLALNQNCITNCITRRIVHHLPKVNKSTVPHIILFMTNRVAKYHYFQHIQPRVLIMRSPK